jgi:oxygen-independent coproporphyrinogen-3 oxidase
MTTTVSPGLYVHVPFCRSKCRYCGFFSIEQPELRERWLNAVAVEAERHQDDWAPFDTLYVGGGTPSLLDERAIGELTRIASEVLRLDRHAERTLEINPGDVTPARARHWRSLGFSRASVGVQSFHDDELRWLGRRHDATQAVHAITDLRSAGFESVGIDLVQGLPRQTLDARLESLQRALDCEPDHLSCYELTVEPDTPLARDIEADRYRMPDTDAAADGFLAVSSQLCELGWLHYEISNFARTEADRSRHNGKYWDHTPYLGLGPAAHSFAARKRWANVRSVEDYVHALESGEAPTAFHEGLSDEQLRWERISLGLRTSRGIELTDVPRHDGGAAVTELEEQGLIHRRGERLVPTVQGFLVADALARRLLFDDSGAPP